MTTTWCSIGIVLLLSIWGGIRRHRALKAKTEREWADAKKSVEERNRLLREKLQAALPGVEIQVAVRFHNGSQVDLESKLIGLMVDWGMEVRSLSRKEASRLWKQNGSFKEVANFDRPGLTFIGTLHTKEGNFGLTHYTLDYRLLTGPCLQWNVAAHVVEGTDDNCLVMGVFEHLAIDVRRFKEILTSKMNPEENEKPASLTTEVQAAV